MKDVTCNRLISELDPLLTGSLTDEGQVPVRVHGGLMRGVAEKPETFATITPRKGRVFYLPLHMLYLNVWHGAGRCKK